MARMQARYRGTCAVCGEAIQVGDLIDYDRTQGGARHPGCTPFVAPSGALWISVGQGYGGEPFHVGEVVRNPRRTGPSESSAGHGEMGEQGGKQSMAQGGEEEEPEYLTVLHAAKTYYRQDGMSFGVGDEQGYVYSACCRAATEDESTPLQAEEEAAKERQQHLDRRRTLFPRSEGEYVPLGPDFDGILHGTWYKLGEGFTIYGGGEEFCIEEGEGTIWHAINNGMDGDDWSRNNLRTGGAGAIGLRYRATPERLAWVRTLEPAIPAAPPATQVYDRFFAGQSDPLLWPAREAQGPDAPSNRVIWSESGTGNRYLGLSTDESGCWLGAITGQPVPGAPTFYLNHQYGVALRFPATAARIAVVRVTFPSWVGTDLRGRFTGMGYGDTSDNAPDALRNTLIQGEPVQRVKVEPGITPVHVHAKWQIWSDGKVTRNGELGSWYSYGARLRADAEYRAKHLESMLVYTDGWPELRPAPPTTPPPMGLTEDAIRLVTLAVKGGTGNPVHPRDLLDIERIIERRHLAKHEWGGSGWSGEVALEEIRVALLGGAERRYYHIEAIEGGLVDGEGDVDEQHLLFANRADAEAAYHREVANHREATR